MPNDCRLRPMVEADGEIVLRWRNADHVRKNMYSDHLIARDEHERWFGSALQSKSAVYLIFERDGQPLGLVSFTDIDRHNGKCSWAFYLGETGLRPGTGSIMEYLALQYAFGELGIRKLCCEVLDFNAGVIKLHGKFGFKQEAQFVAHRLKGDRYCDVIGLALFRHDWEQDKPRLYEMVSRGRPSAVDIKE